MSDYTDMTGGDFYDQIDAPQYLDFQRFMNNDGTEADGSIAPEEYFRKIDGTGHFDPGNSMSAELKDDSFDFSAENENPEIPEQSLISDNFGTAARVHTTPNRSLTPKVLIVLSGLGQLQMTPALGYDQDKDTRAKDGNEKNAVVELESRRDSGLTVSNTSVKGSIDTESDAKGTGDSGATAQAPKVSSNETKLPLFRPKYTFVTRPETTGYADMRSKGKGLMHGHGPSASGTLTSGVPSASGSTAGPKKFTIPVPFRLTEIQPKKPVEIKETKFIFKARPAPKHKLIQAEIDIPQRSHTALALPTSNNSESRIREQAKLQAANTFEARRKAEIEKKAIEKEKRKAELAKKMAESEIRRKAELEKKKADIEARKLETERKMIEAKERRKLAMEKKDSKNIEKPKTFDFKARPAPKFIKHSTADRKSKPIKKTV